MFDLDQIKSYFPWELQQVDFMLKEYLQYKILSYVYLSPFASWLVFLWWTALRIAYQSQRFSEDLDFDNFGLAFDDFEKLWWYIQQKLQYEWLEVEIRCIEKWAFHCHIKIPELLHRYQLAPMKTQKILIQIDTASQWYTYTPTPMQISKFDTQALINVCSPELILSMKLYTVFERKRMKWRDFFDIVFLLGRTKKPDWWFLELKLWITTPHDLKSWLLEKCAGLDFAALQADVQPFLFQPQNQSVKNFVQFVEMMEFEE